MEWKKDLLLANKGKKIFIDEYGCCRFSVGSVLINDRSLSDYYVFDKESGDYVTVNTKFLNDDNEFFDSLKRLFLEPIFKAKSLENTYVQYGHHLTSERVVKTNVKNVKVELHVIYWTHIMGGNTDSARETIDLGSEKDIYKYECWCPTDENNMFAFVDFASLKEGDEYYLPGHGKIKVNKVFPYPNDKNIICEVILDDENKTCLGPNSELYHLPYVKVEDLFDAINHSYDELKLSPSVERQKEYPSLYNVYWNKLDNAFSYTVSLYKVVVLNSRKKVLHLADYQVDRNNGYLALDKLAGENFIFKVKAEDKGGKIISESRGIRARDKVPNNLSLDRFN